MEDVQCEICFLTYQNGTIVPRVVDCGHTFCTSCIAQQINSSRDCPECRQQLGKDNAEGYPINYALLRLIDTIKNPANIKTNLEKKLNALKIKFVAMEMELTLNLSEMSAALDYQSEISAALNSIEKLLVAEDLDVVQTNDTITNLNEKLAKISCNSSHENIRNSVPLKRDNDDTNEDFLQDIYNRIINNEELYALAKIENEVKFARFSRYSSKLLLHAFGPSPQRKDIKTIWFDDIKSCFNTNFGAFLDIDCNEKGKRAIILIEIVESSRTVPFLKYCTGETGPVYKGTTFVKGSARDHRDSIIRTTTNDENFENYLNMIGNSNYNVYQNSEVLCTADKNGCISIVELYHSIRLDDVVGRIQNKNDIIGKISWGGNLKIKDSGIMIGF